MVIISEEWRAYTAWPILTDLATRGGTITYSALAKHLGHGATAIGLTCMLDLVGGHCHRNGLPPLTRVVVSKATKRPSVGFDKWDHSREGEVYTFNWASIQNPFEYARDG